MRAVRYHRYGPPAALRSPVLDELRADSRTLPPFAGGSRHHPMWLQRFDGVGH